MGKGFCAWWQRHKRRVLPGLYAAAALLLLAATFADPLLTVLGILPERRLTLADFTHVGTELLDGATVTTATDDAQLLLEGGAMRSLWVRCSFSLDPGEFVAFYERRPGAPFSARKMIYARQYGDWYVFPLPYGTTRLRLDLGVAPSITVHFAEIVLNRRVPPALPTDMLVWAAVLPGLAFAVTDLLAELLAARGSAAHREGETAP